MQINHIRTSIICNPSDADGLMGQTEGMETTDTIAGKEFKEVVVEAQMSMPIEDGQAYIPGARSARITYYRTTHNCRYIWQMRHQYSTPDTGAPPTLASIFQPTPHQ